MHARTHARLRPDLVYTVQRRSAHYAV
jgi:hypothetical protein